MFGFMDIRSTYTITLLMAHLAFHSIAGPQT